MMLVGSFALLFLTGASTLPAAPTRATLLAPTTTTFTFVGTCGDCHGSAQAELTLSNYSLGDTINLANFVSFHYDGTDLLAAYSITAGNLTSLYGHIAGTLPAAESVRFSSFSRV